MVTKGVLVIDRPLSMVQSQNSVQFLKKGIMCVGDRLSKIIILGLEWNHHHYNEVVNV